VCFSIREAIAISDSLWARLDQRAQVATLRKLKDLYQRQNKWLSADLDLCSEALLGMAEARGLAEAQRIEAAALAERRKGRGLRGFLLGVAAGATVTTIVIFGPTRL
jgi:hypothetical protein